MYKSYAYKEMGVSFHYKGEGESLKWGLYFNRIS
jgi:hypothetical protein